MELYDFIITIFVMVDDFCKQKFPARNLRQRGFLPKLADSEVITMEIVGEYLGLYKDKDIYHYFKRHWQTLFPLLPDRSNFIRQAANLYWVKKSFFDYLQNTESSWFQIIDSMPIEVCKFVRAKNTKLFKGSAAYGKWCGVTFFGYRLHLKITQAGLIHSFILAPANIHDISCVDELLEKDCGGWVLADKGYRSEPLRQRLWKEYGITFHTAVRRIDAQHHSLPIALVKRLRGIRRLIETVAGQLEDQFSIKLTTARDLWHLANRIIRKIISHTIGIILNMRLGRPPLQLKSVIC